MDDNKTIEGVEGFLDYLKLELEDSKGFEIAMGDKRRINLSDYELLIYFDKCEELKDLVIESYMEKGDLVHALMKESLFMAFRSRIKELKGLLHNENSNARKTDEDVFYFNIKRLSGLINGYEELMLEIDSTIKMIKIQNDIKLKTSIKTDLSFEECFKSEDDLNLFIKALKECHFINKRNEWIGKGIRYLIPKEIVLVEDLLKKGIDSSKFSLLFFKKFKISYTKDSAKKNKSKTANILDKSISQEVLALRNAFKMLKKTSLSSKE